MSRWGPSVDGSLTTLGVVAAGVVALSVVALQSGGTARQVVAGPAQQVAGTDQGGSSSTTVTGPAAAQKAGTTQANRGTGATSTTTTAVDPGCAAGHNGGATDRGITANSIRLGATVVQSGIGASFLGSVRVALNAVKNDVNRSGGICGRTLSLKLVDDGWDATRGYAFIQNLVEGDGVFALAVDPSSEGVRSASKQGYFARTKTPVVGSDGMLNDQYTDPWVWPIAASTVTTMHVMAHDACTRLNKKRFSIVFDSRYHFGVEGAYAFNAAVKRCTGSDIPGYFDPFKGTGCSRFCAIAAGKPSYETENKDWNDACFENSIGQQCDFTAFLLEPNEGVNFLRLGTRIGVDKGMAQTLFTRDFASRCGSICDNAMVWTGYNPPIEEFAGLEAVKRYVSIVKGESRSVDVLNQFLEGGYDGMLLLVEALKRLGANPTREGLKATLDAMDFDNGLTTPLRWRPGHHFANAAMHAFAISYKGGSFNGFRSVTGWVRDPYLGQDVT